MGSTPVSYTHLVIHYKRKLEVKSASILRYTSLVNGIRSWKIGSIYSRRWYQRVHIYVAILYDFRTKYEVNSPIHHGLGVLNIPSPNILS